MHRIIVAVLVLLVGCTAARETAGPADGARVVGLTSLPPLSVLSSVGGVRFDAMFLVRLDGSVSDVRLVGSSGDLNWDRAAADSMRQWRFALEAPDSSLEMQWIRAAVIVQAQEPVMMTLGVLVAGTLPEADSLYALIGHGEEFNSLAKERPADPSNQCGWLLGAVDILKYPPHVREALRVLAVNDVTHPLRMDSRYVIFKRLEAATP